MSEKYVAANSQPYVWHSNPDCPLSHGTELVEVEEAPDVAHACSHTSCADGFTANDLKRMGEKP